mmetsp:Transcript_5580/g.14187  ORF Transcript_5580/g.14187 Transcript_5580/m.14187 type:complete len:391 (-) Transcript_5580:117-1289(-)
MGAYLSTPVTEKEKFDGQGHKVRFGGCEMQGWRRTMEDAHIADTSIGGNTGEPGTAQLFGVFDGHGGSEVAKFCQLYMAGELEKQSHFHAGDNDKALQAVFHRMDEMLRDGTYFSQIQSLRCRSKAEMDADGEDGPVGKNDALEVLKKMLMLKRMMNNENGGDAGATDAGGPSDAAATQALPAPGSAAAGSGAGDMDADEDCELPEHKIQAGCTAVVAMIRDGKIFVGNAGDSRAVLCRGGSAVPLSNDHKPAHEIEKNRIEAAGGFLSDIGGVCRVNGNLNLSRAIGDLKYKGNADLAPKDQIITAHPDVMCETICAEDEFLLLACDGVWDVMSNQQAVDFIRKRLTASMSISDVAAELVDACLAADPKETRGIGCDNMTALIVQLNTP